jgi:hypothetical protein
VSSPTGATIPGTLSLVPGTQADDAVATFIVPFNFSIYDTPVNAGTSLTVSTNGNLQFVSSGGSTTLTNQPLPAPGVIPFQANAAIVFAYWDDLDLRGVENGVYTGVTGSAPDRSFIVRWRGAVFATTATVEFAAIFREGSNAFCLVYPASPGGTSATVGVQAATTGTRFTQFSFNQALVPAGTVIAAQLPGGGALPLDCPISLSPSVAYVPPPGDAVDFTGVTTIGTTGTGTIVATPSGGIGTGADATTTINGCTLGGANPGSFAGAAGINLSFAGNTTTAQNISLTCTSQQAAQTATLTCDETRGSAAAVQRQWPLSCPAGTPVAPNIAYNPTTGTTVNFTGVTTIGTTGNAAIVATPSGGIGTGAGATTTINGCTLGGANPGSFAGAAGVNLSFAGNTTTAQNINLTCTSQQAAQAATLTCSETRGSAAAVQRQWPLSCPAGALLPLTSAPIAGATITFPTLFPNSPSSSTVTFTNPNPVPVMLNCSIPGPSVFSVNPATVNVAAGGSTSATVTLQAPAAGTYSGTLTCAITGGQSFTFNLTGQVLVATAIPSNDIRGLLLLALLVLMIGLPALSRQHR